MIAHVESEVCSSKQPRILVVHALLWSTGLITASMAGVVRVRSGGQLTTEYLEI